MGYNTIAEIPGHRFEGRDGDARWSHGFLAFRNRRNRQRCRCVRWQWKQCVLSRRLDLKPRRTIRVGLWSGEEQGLLGSRAYVAEHFGRLKIPPSTTGDGRAKRSAPETESQHAPAGQRSKTEYEKFSGYFNLDNGTGKIRGVYLQGNEGVRHCSVNGWRRSETSAQPRSRSQTRAARTISHLTRLVCRDFSLSRMRSNTTRAHTTQTRTCSIVFRPTT